MISTDSLGKFSFKDLESGSYTLRYSKNGYKATSPLEFQLNADSSTKTYNIEMIMDDPELKTVIFDKNGGDTCSCDSITVEKGKSIGGLPTATRQGCEFMEWNTAQDGTGIEFTGSTAVKEDMIVYAQWRGNVIELSDLLFKSYDDVLSMNTSFRYEPYVGMNGEFTNCAIIDGITYSDGVRLSDGMPENRIVNEVSIWPNNYDKTVYAILGIQPGMDVKVLDKYVAYLYSSTSMNNQFYDTSLKYNLEDQKQLMITVSKGKIWSIAYGIQLFH